MIKQMRHHVVILEPRLPEMGGLETLGRDHARVSRAGGPHDRRLQPRRAPPRFTASISGRWIQTEIRPRVTQPQLRSAKSRRSCVRPHVSKFFTRLTPGAPESNTLEQVDGVEVRLKDNKPLNL